MKTDWYSLEDLEEIGAARKHVSVVDKDPTNISFVKALQPQSAAPPLITIGSSDDTSTLRVLLRQEASKLLMTKSGIIVLGSFLPLCVAKKFWRKKYRLLLQQFARIVASRM
jgi:hypothetical protein